MEKLIYSLNKLDRNTWNNKSVLVTGHTGFKGSWLAFWLAKIGAKVYGYALAPNTDPSLFSSLNLEDMIEHREGDIRDVHKFQAFINASKPEVIFHLAAQPIVSTGYNDPVGTFETNIMGVVNLLDYFRKESIGIPVIVVSSDKCYENDDSGRPFKISDRLGGRDPYSASKAGTELVVGAYRNSFFQAKNTTSLASVRAGNVIGGGDWSENRLIPDAAVAFSRGKPLIIRDPNATRPWQHVLEPLYGYLLLAQGMMKSRKFNKPWNFGPDPENTQTVKKVSELMVQYWNNGAKTRISKNQQSWKEAKALSLDVTETVKNLGFTSVLDINDTVKWTSEWYYSYYNDQSIENVRSLCENQISNYVKLQKSAAFDA